MFISYIKQIMMYGRTQGLIIYFSCCTENWLPLTNYHSLTSVTELYTHSYHLSITFSHFKILRTHYITPTDGWLIHALSTYLIMTFIGEIPCAIILYHRSNIHKLWSFLSLRILYGYIMYCLNLFSSKFKNSLCIAPQ